jgi:hypothetical protein
MRQTICGVLIIALTMSQTVHANTVRHYSGNECADSTTTSQRSQRFDEGCINTQATCNEDAQVRLPISGIQNPGLVDFDSAGVYYYDGINLDSVQCAFIVMNTSGTGFYGTNQSSGSAATGFGALSWSGGSLPNGGAAIANVTSLSFGCNLPQRAQGPGCVPQNFSLITGYAINTVLP